MISKKENLVIYRRVKFQQRGFARIKVHSFIVDSNISAGGALAIIARGWEFKSTYGSLYLT